MTDDLFINLSNKRDKRIDDRAQRIDQIRLCWCFERSKVDPADGLRVAWFLDADHVGSCIKRNALYTDELRRTDLITIRLQTQ